jgi:hypothetical protein
MRKPRHTTGSAGAFWPAVFLALIAIPAAAVDVIKIDSEDGDYIGAGQDYYFSSDAGSFTLSRNPANGITIEFLGLDNSTASVELAGPDMSALAPGSYADAERYLPFNNIPLPMLRVQPGTARECNQLRGSFEIHELAYLPDDSVDSLAVDIEQFCETSLRKLSARVRINSAWPVGPVGLIANAGADQTVSPNAPLQLDGSLSSATDGEPFTYHWQQIAGPGITLDNPNLESPTFTAPGTPNREYEILQFRLTIADGLLRQSIDEVTITVAENVTPATILRIDAQGYLGFSFDKTIVDAPGTLFAFERSSDNGIRLDLTENAGAGADEISSLLELSAPFAQQLSAGSYDFALLNASRPVTLPGLNFIYDSLGSTAPLGRFDILELAYQPNGAVDRLAVNFEISDTDPQNPNLPTEPALGYLRYNSVVPLAGRAPIASAGADRIFFSDESIAQLDASGTLDQNIASLVYSWKQTSGPALNLIDSGTPTPSFVPPQSLLAGAGVFAFELGVTNENGYVDTDRVDVTVLGPNDPKTYLYLGGAPGGPATQALLKPDRNYISFEEVDSANSSFDNGVSVNAHGTVVYNLVMGDKTGSELAVGVYAASRASSSAFNALLAMTSAGTACDSGGAFRVYELVRGGAGQIESIAADFMQRCPQEPLYGAVRINSLVPFDPDLPTAIAGSGFRAALGETVLLDASDSWDIDGDIVAYQWLQTGGSAVSLQDADTSTASFDVGYDPMLLQPLEFQLTVTDDDGNSHSAEVAVEVILPGTVFSGLLLFGDEGDSGFSGPAQYNHDDRGRYSILGDAPDHIVVEAGNLEFEIRARAGGQLLPGNYEDALAPDSGIGLFPAMMLRNLPACSHPSGRFVILELVRDGLNQIQSLAIDFEQDCADDGSKFRGALRFNTTVPFRNPVPNAAAGDDIIASEGEFILLDGRYSRDADGGIRQSSWRQLSGPSVALEFAGELRSSFVVPGMSAGSTLVFELTVEDEDGNFDTDEISVEVRQLRSRANIVRKTDGRFEYIDLSELRMVFAISRTGQNDVLRFVGKDDVSLSLARNGHAQLVAGRFAIDNRLIPAADSISFGISGPNNDYQQDFLCRAGDGFGERNREGWVDIREVEYDSSDVVEKLAFDFEVFCNGNFFWGSVQVDSELFRRLVVPMADSGNLTGAREASEIRLSATGSSIAYGQIDSYQWQQISGVRVILSNADQVVATAILPEIGPSYNPYIEFELVVTGDSGFRDRDIARIRISDRPVTPPSSSGNNGHSTSASSGGSGGASSFSAPLLVVLALIGLAAAGRSKTSLLS